MSLGWAEAEEVGVERGWVTWGNWGPRDQGVQALGPIPVEQKVTLGPPEGLRAGSEHGQLHGSCVPSLQCTAEHHWGLIVLEMVVVPGKPSGLCSKVEPSYEATQMEGRRPDQQEMPFPCVPAPPSCWGHTVLTTW
jgi:hypothetical protein